MITIRNDQLCAEISEFGAELISLTDTNGTNYMWKRDAAIWGQSAPNLFPICGRLRDGKYRYEDKEYELSIHGFVKSSNFTVVQKSESSVSLLLSQTPETLAAYPFAFDLTVTFALVQKSLCVEYTVRNTDVKQIYFSVGGHYGFALDAPIDAYSVKFDAPTVLKREILDGAFLSGQTVTMLEGGDTLPLSEDICTNDTYVFRSAPRACTLCKGNAEILRLEYPDTPNLLIWTLPGAGFVCLEPWNGSPDGKESGEIRNKIDIMSLRPDTSKIIAHKISIL